MQRWSCPACGREFGKKRAHVCAPSVSVDGYFASRPPHEREIFEALREHIESLGPVIVEAVGVGIFFKTTRNIAELRPKSRWMDLSFGLNRRLQHQRISRTIPTNGPRTHHALRITSPEDIDDDVRSWLTEAYFELSG